MVDESGLLSYLEKHPLVVSVGDQVTDTLLQSGISPLCCIIDYQIKRVHDNDEIIHRLRKYGSQVIKVENPQGVITEELWTTIEEAFQDLAKHDTLRIEVIGEEDLAGLPAIVFAPENVTIIYGMPDKGVVVVPSSVEN